MINTQAIRTYLLALQNSLCDQLQAFDGNKQPFIRDAWERPSPLSADINPSSSTTEQTHPSKPSPVTTTVERQGGASTANQTTTSTPNTTLNQALMGDGLTCVLQQGEQFESAGVNFSHVKGEHLPDAATRRRPELAGRTFEAMGVSSVLHPRHPFIPTAHMNVRFFVATHPTEAPVWWFGGGYDLTPYYGFVEDCVHWHQTAKRACDVVDPSLYSEFKAWADRYFYLPHRQEPRGIGGLFFDDFNRYDIERCFLLMQQVGDTFLKAYLPIATRRVTMPYTEAHVAFQRYRRGRYVEFNLLYDRGTRFGIQSGGRTASILMSLPPTVTWQYDWQPAPESVEARFYDDFLKPRDWLYHQ